MNIADIKVEISDSQPDTIRFTGKDGKEQSFQKQEAYLHHPDHRYPEKFEITPPKGKGLYAPGMYMVKPADIRLVGRYGQLTIIHELVPVAK